MRISAACSSGMRVAATRHDISAHNTANVNTPGFSPSRAAQVEVSPEGVRIAGMHRGPAGHPPLSGTSLVEESSEQIINKNTLSANAAAFKTRDRMIGELLDMVG